MTVGKGYSHAQLCFVYTENVFDRLNSELDFQNLHRAGGNLLHFGRKAHVSDNHNGGSALYPG